MLHRNNGMVKGIRSGAVPPDRLACSCEGRNPVPSSPHYRRVSTYSADLREAPALGQRTPVTACISIGSAHRSDERSVGTEWVSTRRDRWRTSTLKKNKEH